MLDPIMMSAIGAGVGLLKNELIDKPAAEQKRRSQFITMRLSPWTGRQAGEIQQNPSEFNAAMQGGVAGYSLGQNMLANQAIQNTPQRSSAYANILSPQANISQPTMPSNYSQLYAQPVNNNQAVSEIANAGMPVSYSSKYNFMLNSQNPWRY